MPNDRQTITLEFPAPSDPVSENRTRGRHWGAVRDSLAGWGDAAWAHYRNHRIRNGHPGPIPFTIQVVLPFAEYRRRDPHNYVGTNVKAIVDGLVRGGLVPDDTPEWVTVLEPVLEVHQDPRRRRVRVIITPREDPQT